MTNALDIPSGKFRSIASTTTQDGLRGSHIRVRSLRLSVKRLDLIDLGFQWLTGVRLHKQSFQCTQTPISTTAPIDAKTHV
jgi:hypothetical protein